MVRTEREKGKPLTDSLYHRLPECLNSPTEGNNSQYRYKIRERVNGVLDQIGGIGYNLPTEDVETIFTQVYSENETNEIVHEHGGGCMEIKAIENPENVSDFRRRVVGGLSLFIQGVMKMPSINHTTVLETQNEYGKRGRQFSENGGVGEWSEPDINLELGAVLSEAVEIAAQKQGKKVTKCKIDIETEPLEDIEDIERRFYNDELISPKEAIRLHRETDVSGSELQERLKNNSDSNSTSRRP